MWSVITHSVTNALQKHAFVHITLTSGPSLRDIFLLSLFSLDTCKTTRQYKPDDGGSMFLKVNLHVKSYMVSHVKDGGSMFLKVNRHMKSYMVSHAKDGGSMFLENVDNHTQGYMVS
jgi:hypothetical protein